ncbi:rod shape-determining protein MreD [Dermacoccaceae bacterium W4C1]
MSLRLPSRLTTLQGLCLLGAALVQAVVLPHLFGAAAPDLVLVVIVATALRAGSLSGVLMGVAGGWMIDLMPPGTGGFGLTALWYAALGALAGTAAGWVRSSPLWPLAATGLCAAGAALGAGVLTLLRGHTPDLGAGALGVLLTAVVGALVVPALMHRQRRLVARGRD